MFGNSAARAAAGEGLTRAERAFQNLVKLRLGDNDWKLGGFSLEDFAARINLLIAIYVPQTLLAFLENVHKWETFGRNLIVFLLTVAVLAYNKSDKWSVNTLLFNRFMRPEKLGGDYHKALEMAGIRVTEADRAKALWAKLNAQDVEKLETVLKELSEKSLRGETLNEAQQAFTRIVPRLLRRMNGFKFASMGIIIVALSLLVGQMAIELVFRTFARLDHDFDRKAFLQGKKHKHALFPPRPRLPSRLVRIKPVNVLAPQSSYAHSPQTNTSASAAPPWIQSPSGARYLAFQSGAGNRGPVFQRGQPPWP